MIRTTLRAQAAALVAAFLLWASPAWSQAVLQGGPVSALGGHVPTYLPSGQGGLATVMDSGGAGGGPIGFGLSEKGLQARTPPGQGTGPFGTHDCDWDTYATNPAGAHYLCFDPNINGSASIVAGATGGATPQGLNLIINGQLFPIAGVVNGLPSVPSTVLLASTPTTFAPAIIRTDYSPGFGAPPVEYVAGSTACSISGGDGGSQIPSADGKCWLLTPQTVYDIRWWGLTSNPVTFYVSQSGADTGFCVVAASPCRHFAYANTIAHEFSTLASYSKIHLGAGAWPEAVTMNGPLPGSGSANVDPAAGFSVPSNGMLLIEGSGSGATTLGPNAQFCGEVIPSDHAVVGFRAIKLLGNGTSCQSTLFAQLSSILGTYDDVVLGPASVEQVHCENAGSSVQIWQGLTLTGGAGDQAIACSDLGETLLSNGTITLAGTNTYGNYFMIDRDRGVLQFNPTPAFALAAGATVSVGSAPFIIYDGGTLEFNIGTTDLAPIFPSSFSEGWVLNGGRVRGPACIGGQGGCYDGTAPTGIGSAGTVTFDPFGTNAYGGVVSLTPGGSGIAATGSVFIGTGYNLLTGLYFNNCVAQTVNIPGGAWNYGGNPPTITVGGDISGTGSLVIAWTNPAGVLTSGGVYPIRWVCNN